MNINDSDADTFAAFKALGGTEKEGSFINASLLIKTIKNEFELTIDIEQLIADIDDVR